ncbi:hypothetical protein [Ekhidna sp.]|uniref:hypothetical protein n=1 Tax=Ekhidna sp. TaxID=2608089 RepID=UPI003CCBDDAA
MRIIITLSVLLPFLSFGQVLIPGDNYDFLDKSSDTTTLTFYSSVIPAKTDGFYINNILFKTSYNSNYARGYNDGPVWKGEGITSELHAGISGRKGKLSFSFNPVIFYSENEAIRLPRNSSGINEFAYPFSNRIDWVFRYGNDPFLKFHPGQSEIRFDIGQFVASVGTQNYSLGPAIYNPIILSRQGGGFPHFRLGIKPTYLSENKNIGKVEANLMYGLLAESEYFDDNSENDNRYLNGMFLAFSPSFLPELTIGFNKVLYKQTQYFENADILSPFFIIDDGVVDGDTLSPNDAFDQMASISMEWNFREIGFRAYLEFAKNDFTSDGGGIRPTAVEPEHSRGYTIGFEKSLENKKGDLFIINYEHSNLSIGHTPWRPTPPFYAHGINRQGYTNDGQLIGAGIGPGGNSDNFGIRYIKDDFSSFILIQRIERDRDYFVNQIRNANLHDMEYTLSIGAQKSFEKYDLFAEAILSHNYSRYYEFYDIGNIGFAFGGRLKL